MPIATNDNLILDIIKEHGPVTTKEIVELAQKQNVSLDKEYINSILYGYFHEVVVRDRNNFNVPTWRLKTQSFEAAKGYEANLLHELIKQKIVSPDQAFLDFTVQHLRHKKTYHLDIALFHHGKQFNIEVDGFDHMRADARQSIEKQIRQNGETCEIVIDWMDNTNSYVDFKDIDTSLVTKWCNKHLFWCITYHEELLWPHDITRNIWLIENGWKVMRLWNIQITANLSGCIKEINEWINVA